MDFSRNRLERLLVGGYDKAVREDKATFIAFYSYLFDDADPCTSCTSKMLGYWRRLTNEGLTKLKRLEEMARTKEEVKNEVNEAPETVQENTVQENEVNEAPEKCMFKLREGIGALQMEFGSSEWFNNDTLTNDIALRYLAGNPNRIANFAVFPNNWEELVK